MNSEEARRLIRERGHYEIKIWPMPYREDLLPDSAARATFWESCEARLMGWAYPAPYTARAASDNGECLEMVVDYEGFLEVVRVYPSGQVAHLRGFFEDWPERRRRRRGIGDEDGERYLWVDGLLGTITGAFRFAHKVAKFTESDEVDFRIALNGTERRRLKISNSLFPHARGSDVTNIESWNGHLSILPDWDEGYVDDQALQLFGEVCAALTYPIPRDYPNEWKERQAKL